MIENFSGTMSSDRHLSKTRTGIAGLDEITRGGLPRGRPTLVCGGAGCGKTVLAMQFLTRGATDFDEAGVFVSFDETAGELSENFRSLGMPIDNLIDAKKLHVCEIRPVSDESVEVGDFSLDGVFVRLERAIARTAAKRVVLDAMEALFSRISNEAILRKEIARLMRWLKDQRVTSIVTAERGDGKLTRRGLEEYISDCVLLLDHRITANISKRRLRVIKYRGSDHGLDEYPFLIGPSGFSVLPITSVMLSDPSNGERVSTGVPSIDSMLGKEGYYRGSAILISGTAGTGKSTLAAAFANATCQNHQKCLYLAFEEASGQIVRNMRSVGMDLAPWIDSGLLHIQALRPTLFGLEEHLVSILEISRKLEPQAVIMDPITNFVSIGPTEEVKSMLTRVFDHYRERGITALVTSLTSASQAVERTDTEVSSMMDTWLVLSHEFDGNHRRRWMYVAKARGMDHVMDRRRLVLSSDGIFAEHPQPVERQSMLGAGP